MQGLEITSNDQKLVLSIDKKNFSEDVLLEVMKVARLEYLIEKAAAREDVLRIGDEIKSDWWEKNKALYLSRV